MKKALALILAIAMVFALAACGQTSAPANEEIPTAGTTNTVSEKPRKYIGGDSNPQRTNPSPCIAPAMSFVRRLRKKPTAA